LARKDDIAGVAVASGERIEAYLLYAPGGVGLDGHAEAGPPAFARNGRSDPRRDGGGLPAERAGEMSPPWHGRAAAVAEAAPRAGAPAAEIVSLRSFVEDGGARLRLLLARLRGPGMGTLRFPKVHPAEISEERLATLGFRPAGGHVRYAAMARADWKT
jgi:hypothetical protein